MGYITFRLSDVAGRSMDWRQICRYNAYAYEADQPAHADVIANTTTSSPLVVDLTSPRRVPTCASD